MTTRRGILSGMASSADVGCRDSDSRSAVLCLTWKRNPPNSPCATNRTSSVDSHEKVVVPTNDYWVQFVVSRGSLKRLLGRALLEVDCKGGTTRYRMWSARQPGVMSNCRTAAGGAARTKLLEKVNERYFVFEFVVFVRFWTLMGTFLAMDE